MKCVNRKPSDSCAFWLGLILKCRMLMYEDLISNYVSEMIMKIKLVMNRGKGKERKQKAEK